ncbi:MAG: MmcQ/YjbR family DNA-binding protein [Gemmatimonadota bacterium]
MTAKPRKKASALPPAALKAAFEPVLKAANGLPEVEEGTSYGTPALYVGGKFFARIWEDGETLVIRADFDSRDAMLRVKPNLFYITDHYLGYPAMLIRLGVITERQLATALSDSWEFVAPKRLVRARGEAAALKSRASARPAKRPR